MSIQISLVENLPFSNTFFNLKYTEHVIPDKEELNVRIFLSLIRIKIFYKFSFSKYEYMNMVLAYSSQF